MPSKPLVSIITPCYNSEKFIHRLLDSVLAQTYTNIELIIVDDGSTDKTQEIIHSYSEKFTKKNILLHYQYQTNAGQAAAINTGLLMLTGKYFTWIDSDDFLKPNSIETRVNILEKHGEGYFCISKFEIAEEQTLKVIATQQGRVQPNREDTYFYDLIVEKNVQFAGGGGFMIHRTDFAKACPKFQIFPSREGQNWQLMLPITYHYKCIYINETLYTIVVRENSHSREQRSSEQVIQRNNNFIKLLSETIKSMVIPEEQELLKIINLKYAKQNALISLKKLNISSIINNIYKIYTLGGITELIKFFGKSIQVCVNKFTRILGSHHA